MYIRGSQIHFNIQKHKNSISMIPPLAFISQNSESYISWWPLLTIKRPSWYLIFGALFMKSLSVI